MRAESGGEWPSKLQPAVFAANTQIKKSTGFTPFRIMFGRDHRPEYLLNLTKSDSDDTIIPEDDISVDDNPIQSEEMILNDPKEWVYEDTNQRQSDLEIAKKNIEIEQSRQKRI